MFQVSPHGDDFSSFEQVEANSGVKVEAGLESMMAFDDDGNPCRTSTDFGNVDMFVIFAVSGPMLQKDVHCGVCDLCSVWFPVWRLTSIEPVVCHEIHFSIAQEPFNVIKCYVEQFRNLFRAQSKVKVNLTIVVVSVK